ncbi:polysaccharide deacetylase family protein [Flavobacterium sp. NRK1]|uniref:polysaccharide deacetylase family protein n=1 Tax=Flavobacterium sp. NRK1 TaxID=2954929 RepID=UPI0020934BF5|nr:polysaccharide deacetylase family protein [Flavobacterium sp. NRK1]MCO6147281.1 polysaccharide deacetylase family protein [Flavobacterium sp. NRK1]
MLTHKINTGFLLAVIFLLAVFSIFNPLPWWLFGLPILLWFTIAALGSAFVQSGYHIKTLNKNLKTPGRQIAITFDDGPTPETPKVLALLKKYNTKATFFCIGQQIEKHPDIFKTIIEEGHTVGNHTFTHSPKMGFFSVQKVMDEVTFTDRIIKNYGLKPLLFRPPYGVTHPNLSKVLKQTCHYVIGWNIRSLDTVIKQEQKIFMRIKKRLAPGSIILLHDTSQKTINVLEQLLILLQQEKYNAVTVNELLNIPAYEE